MGELSRKGLTSYLPAVREHHQWRDRKKIVDVLVFSGYVFVRATSSVRDRLTVLNTAGAVRILGFGGVPEPVPDKTVEDIRKLVTSGTPFVTHGFLKEGARVIVTRGPLRGICGILETVKNGQRLILSVELLSQSVAAEVDLGDVEAARPEWSAKVRAQGPGWSTSHGERHGSYDPHLS